MSDERRPHLAEPEVLDPGVAQVLNRDSAVPPGSELVADVSQAEDLRATGEGYALPVHRKPPLDPKEAIKRMQAYTELVKVRAVEIMKQRAFAVGMTNKHHWNNIEGNPYLNKSGARLLQRVFRVAERHLSCERTWHEDELGKFYQYEYRAMYDAGGDFDCVSALGTRNQRGRFFAKKKEIVKDENGKSVMEKSRDGKREYPKRETVWRDLSEIDPGNIQKSAYTNCLVNGIQALLALEGITWEELSELTGGKVSADQCQAVSFGGRDASGKMGPASDGQVRMLFAKAYKAGNGCLDALCKHLGIPKLREGDKDSPGQIHVQGNQVNEAVKFIENWGRTNDQAAAAEGTLTRQEAETLTQGKEMLGISDEDWKRKWGQLPQNMKRALFPKAQDWLNAQADK